MRKRGIFPAELVRVKTVLRDNERADMLAIHLKGDSLKYEGQLITERLAETRKEIEEIKVEQKVIMRRRMLTGGKP